MKALKSWLIEKNIKSDDLELWRKNNKITLEILKNKIFDKEDYSDNNTLLQKNPNTDKTSPTVIKHSILQYVLSKKPEDLQNGITNNLSAYKAAIADPKLEIHHIIPLNSVTKIGESTKELRNDKKHILNSPLNLTYISDTANGMIRDKSIDEYFIELSSFSLGTHFIPKIDKKPTNDKEIENFLEGRFLLIKSDVIQFINSII